MRPVRMFALLAMAIGLTAGPVDYGICQVGCASVVTPCYAAAGATIGTVAAPAAPAAIVACNLAFAMCQAASAVVTLARTAWSRLMASSRKATIYHRSEEMGMHGMWD
ncbi:hypothetical protein VMCG_06011 [Cytospora schulzeri]|uniref:Uncharacterized protein n=1 Tax=Cytospora schulzeri TaxID=448051 RepID=A0A423WGE3_9PEZI|nr:hypothetical protein VMCG_06011 [Valsa malicola]